MACLICGVKYSHQEVLSYVEPDKYEKYMGITDVHRAWWLCANCGHFNQTRNYPLADLEKIYKHGYRDKEFRGKTIQEAYDEIMGFDDELGTENLVRCNWFLKNTLNYNTLDIGSGLGVFPKKLLDNHYRVECVEENELSCEFISGVLGIPCYNIIPEIKYGNVTLVHVLEHIEKPDEFLRKIRGITKSHLFVEVPDAREFAYLDKDHDEFNSCHLWFFTLQNLITLIERNGFKVVEASRNFYDKRKLSRILVLASCD